MLTLMQLLLCFYLQHVLRGIHVSPYAKLLTCVYGAVYDVLVDVRPKSPSYLSWAAVELTEDNCRQLFIPPNCGHGFYSLSDNSTVIYCQVVGIKANLLHSSTLMVLTMSVFSTAVLYRSLLCRSCVCRRQR